MPDALSPLFEAWIDLSPREKQIAQRVLALDSRDGALWRHGLDSTASDEFDADVDDAIAQAAGIARRLAASAKVHPKTREELLRNTRENAVERTLKAVLQRALGNYIIDGARGLISQGGVRINYRELALEALARIDAFDRRPQGGFREARR